MDRTKQIVSRLKPKVKAFGFNHKELKGVAARIADNLTLEDDASDEDVNAAIDEAIEAVIPLLEVGRSYANRAINDSKKNEDEDNDDDESGENNHPSSKQTPKPGKSANANNKDEEPAWFKSYRETMEKKLAAIEGQRTADSRKSRLDSILKNAGLTDKAIGKRTLKNFAKMTFENDEEFDEFIADVEDDVKAYKQEQADAGLENTPPGGGGGGSNKPQELTDAEIDELVAAMP